MFYPELSPAMRWQLEQHQKMYSMYHSMESGKMALGDQYGEIGMDGMIIFWMFVIESSSLGIADSLSRLHSGREVHMYGRLV